MKSLPRLEYIKYKRQEARRQTKSAVKHQGGAQGESLTVVKIVQSVGIVSKLGNKSAFRKTFHAGKFVQSSLDPYYTLLRFPF